MSDSLEYKVEECIRLILAAHADLAAMTIVHEDENAQAANALTASDRIDIKVTDKEGPRTMYGKDSTTVVTHDCVTRITLRLATRDEASWRTKSAAIDAALAGGYPAAAVTYATANLATSTVNILTPEELERENEDEQRTRARVVSVLVTT